MERVKERQRCRVGRHQRISRLSKSKLLYVDPIKAVCGQGRTFVKAVIENSCAGSNDCFRRLSRVCRAGGPGDRKARREVQLAAGVALYFIAQAEAESQIRPIAPIILHVRLNIKLTDGGQRIAGTNTELRRSATGRANLGSGLSLLH